MLRGLSPSATTIILTAQGTATPHSPRQMATDGGPAARRRASRSRARRRGRRENAPRPGCGRLALAAGGLSLAASELARSRAAWLLLHGACPGHVRRTWLVRIFLLYGTLQGGMKRTRSVKGKNRLDFGFRPRENVILPRFWLTKGKNCAILGFQQAFLSWLPIPR